MTLQRTTIRQYLVTQLTAANTDAGSNVFNTRVEPIDESVLPCLNVLIQTDDLDEKSMGYSQFTPTKEARVEIWAAVAGSNANGEAGDALDDLCEQVLAVFKNDKQLGGNASWFEAQGFRLQTFNDVDTPHAIGQMTFQLKYL